MIWPKFVVMVAVLTVVPSSSEYRTQESTEEHNHEEEEESIVNYRKGSRGFDDKKRRPTSDESPESTSEFDRPSGLVNFFPDVPLGLYGMAGETYQRGLPSSNEVSSNLWHEFSSNDSGYVGNTNFPMFFDVSSPTIESDISSHNFSPRLRSEAPRSEGFFSPSFTMLKEDIDREVDYKRNTGSGRSKTAADREKSSEEGKSVELDGFDFSKFNLDESREPDSTEHSSEEHRSNDNGREGSAENTSEDEVNPVTPYSVVNHYHKASSYGPHPSTETTNKRPLTRSHHPEEDFKPQEYGSSFPKRIAGYHETNVPNYYITARAPTSPVFRSHPNLYYRPLVYNSPANLNGYTQAYYPSGRPNTKVGPLYKPVLPKLGGIPHVSRNLNLYYRPKPLFKPSPRDVYLEYSQNNPPAKRRGYPVSALPRHGEQRSSLQVEQMTGVPKKVNPPAVSTYKQKKFCKKAKKKTISREFPRFEPQPMICYTCSDNVTNRTYEECRYEPDPDYGSFSEEDAETRSFNKGSPSPIPRSRHERSVGESSKKARKPYSKNDRRVHRNKRNYDYNEDYSSDEQYHDDYGSESRQYDVDHAFFYSAEVDGWSRENLSDGYDFSFEDDESGEASNIEREFQPPKPSSDGSCH